MNQDYLTKMIDLFKDAFTFRQYRKMHPALAVFVGILQIPFVLVSFALFAVFAVVAFAFKYMRAPLEYYMEFIHNEGERVKHATQAVIYFIAFPFAALLQIVMSLNLLYLFLVWFITVLFVKVWTLNGTNYTLFINEEKKELVKDYGYINPVIPSIEIGVGYLLYVIALILVIAGNSGNDSFYYSDGARQMRSNALVFVEIAVGFVFLFTLIAYHSKAKNANAPKAEATEAPTADPVPEKKPEPARTAEDEYKTLLKEGLITEEEYQDLVNGNGEAK